MRRAAHAFVAAAVPREGRRPQGAAYPTRAARAGALICTECRSAPAEDKCGCLHLMGNRGILAVRPT